MHVVIYTQQRDYDMANFMARVARRFGKYEPVARAAEWISRKQAKLDSLLPGPSPRKLLRTAQEMAPSMTRAPINAVFVNRGGGESTTSLKRVRFPGYVWRSEEGAPFVKVRRDNPLHPVASSSPDVRRAHVVGTVIHVKKQKMGGRTLPVQKAGLAHELAHAMRNARGATLRGKTRASRIMDEAQTHRLAAELMKRAGSSKFRYWVTSAPNIITYGSWTPGGSPG